MIMPFRFIDTTFDDDEELVDLLFEESRHGIYNVEWDDSTGIPSFSLTEKGRELARDLIKKSMPQ